MDKIEQAVKSVDDFIAQYPSITQFDQFKKLEEKTGHSKVYFFLCAALMIVLTIWFTGGLKLMTDLIGFVYPAYMSFQSIESENSSQAGATQWLTYWVVFSVLTVMEGVFPFLSGLIPFYYPLKSALIVWLYHPKTSGAAIIYNQVVRPYVLPYIQPATKKSE